ncbi:nucleotidyltransferase family protein [Magnetovibrio sp. PR-2]|uniref:nucleotidyltransferase family protein n=1 Tax=Magnetovibrio sp. PR-2 TaxID=3120356 RepID=UPI002FCE50CF
MSFDHAMILAAGLGTRMRPLTDTRPKPMVEVAGRTLLDWALARVQDAGVTKAVVNTHYFADQIKDHLKDCTTPAITLSYEDPLLETGGGIEQALPHLGDQPFFVGNSDGLWLDGDTNALTRLATAWNDGAMDGLLLLHDPARALGYDGDGDFVLDANGGLTRKKDAPPHTPAFVFTGVQLLHPRLFAHAPGGIYSLNLLYNEALAKGRLYGLVHDGEWFHVGTPQARIETEAWLIEHGLEA